MTTESLEGSPRERLLAAAAELFYREGVHSVGIDRVIERAGVAKATLYSTYGSKEELVAAYLRSRHEAMRGRMQAAVDRHRTPRERLLAAFDVQADLVADPDYCGCPIANATVEAHGPSVDIAAADYREWIRTNFAELAADAGVLRPDPLARQLQLLWDGCSQTIRMDHDPAAISAARAAAAALVDAALPA